MAERSVSYFLLGLGIGIAAGILLAPKSGQETRELILKKADEGRQFVRRKQEELVESAEELFEKGKSALVRQKQQLAAAIEAGKQAYREALKEQAGQPTSVEEGS